MHILHAVECLDLGLQNHRVVGLGQKVVTAGFQALHQRAGFGQAGKKDDRHPDPRRRPA